MKLRMLLLTLCLTATIRAQIPAAWLTNHAPFRIAGNLYYVGSKDLASYLIVTPAGDILINSSLPASAPLIRQSIEKLGFKIADVKILLISHAHSDHAGGSAALKRITGARYEVMDADVPVVESGGRTDFYYGPDPTMAFPPTKVDRILHDGSTVSLGGTTLTAHLTPGHTKGCTTWTMQVKEAGKTYNVVIVGGVNVNTGFRLAGDPNYPNMAADYAAAFRVLKSLPADIFLGAHGLYFDLNAKYPQLQPGRPNPFIDPAGYRAFVLDAEQQYLAKLAKQTRQAE